MHSDAATRPGKETCWSSIISVRDARDGRGCGGHGGGGWHPGARDPARRGRRSPLHPARPRAGARRSQPVLAAGAGGCGPALTAPDRKGVVSGKRVSVRVDSGGRRIIKKKKEHKYFHHTT